MVCRNGGFKDFFLRTGLVHKVVEVIKDDAGSYKKALAEIGECDWVVAPHMSFRTAVFARKIKAKLRIGFKTRWSFLFYSKTIERPMLLPDALRQLSLLRVVDKDLDQKYQELMQLSQSDSKYWTDLSELKMPSRVPAWATMEVDYTRTSDAALAKFQLKGEPLVFFAPGSVWATKKWTKEGYSALGKMLSDQGFRIVIVGSPEERAECEEIAKTIPKARNLAGEPSLYELGALMSRGRLMIGNDNGAMHLAASSGVPTVAIFGPTVLSFGYRPWSRRALVVENATLSCRPCGKHGHQVCPIGTHECMKSITAEQVMQKAKTWL